MDTNFSLEKPNTKKFGLSIMGNEVTAGGLCGTSNIEDISGGSSEILQYNAVVNNQTTAINETIANAIFTVDTAKYLTSITAREGMEKAEPYFPGDAYNNKLNVTAIYSDGSQESISSSDYTILDGSSLTSGQSSITVKYLDKQCSVPIQTFSMIVYFTQCWFDDSQAPGAQLKLYYMDGMTWRQWLADGYGQASNAGKYFIAMGQYRAPFNRNTGGIADIIYDGTGIKIGVFSQVMVEWWDAYICDSSKQVIDIDSPINSTDGYYVFVNTNMVSTASLSLSSTGNSLTSYSIKQPN